MLKHTNSWRSSEASETVLGVDNAKSGICYMYVCGMVRMPFKMFYGGYGVPVVGCQEPLVVGML